MILRWASGCLLAASLVCYLQGGWIYAKAWLAQELLAQAWESTLSSREAQRPWPWADTYPVARLRIPRLAKEVLVLAGSHGRTLAFGPGLVAGSAEPGTLGNTVVGGHRDTHFAFLRHLRLGERIDLETAEGVTVDYRVTELVVVDREMTSVLNDSGDRRLTLITCYPFDTVVPGGRLRYVVIAVASQV